jgi:hypothetical protein
MRKLRERYQKEKGKMHERKGKVYYFRLSGNYLPNAVSM